MTPDKGSPNRADLTHKCQNEGDEDGVLGSPLVAALEAAWTAIRTRHPEIPQAIMIVGSGTAGRGPGLTLGHFARDRWVRDKDGAVVHEILIGGEGLKLGAGEVLATLLHEAAHALALVRGIKDTSRQGRYHNRQFARLGEELGLAITKDERIGWSVTELPEVTAEAYRSTLDALEVAITVHRLAELHPSEEAKAPSSVPAVCQCDRRIRAAPSILAAGPILCGICQAEFVAVGP